MAQNLNTRFLYDDYSNYKEGSISEKRLKFVEIEQLIKNLEKSGNFSVGKIGESLEGRGIYQITLGKGSTGVLAWSQMHGDESSATMALFDVFNFLRSDDQHNNFRKAILDNLTLHFIPMLNPDGAEKFRRRNAMHIDLNRDALRLQFPESQILKNTRDKIKPEFGFNLHDQNPRYSSGKSFRSAAISFLAPAYNYKKSINTVRSNTMRLIVDIYDELSKYIPGHIGRYNDDFEPRAFGDNFVKWGTSSVLIESGGWKNDREKQFIRKLNFIALLSGFYSIATKSFEKADIERYDLIPENDKMLFDLLLKNVSVDHNGKKYIVDLGINRIESADEEGEKIYYRGVIEDIGDLSIYFGFEEYDFSGYELTGGRVYHKTFDSADEIRELDLDSILSGGYTALK